MESLKAPRGWIPRIFRWIVEHSARQSAMRALYRMPGWRLRDMGIERGRIPEIVDGLLARKRALAAENRRIPGAGQAAGGLGGAAISEASV